MSRDILRDFPSPRATRLGLLVGLPLAIILGPRVVAWADERLSKPWGSSEVLTAKDLNDTFLALKASVDKPTVTLNGKSTSTNGIYCGLTSLATGNSGGYEALKGKCQTACNKPTAHLCSAEEMARSASLKSDPPMFGRYSGGAGFTDGTTFYTDCDGWTNAGTTYRGSFWNGGSGPNYKACNESVEYLCCD